MTSEVDATCKMSNFQLQISTLWGTGIPPTWVTFVFFFVSRETTLGDCYRHHVEINVLKEANNTLLLYEEIKDSSLSIQIPCPDPARNICLTMNGTMSWMKVRFLRPQPRRHWETGTDASDLESESDALLLSRVRLQRRRSSLGSARTKRNLFFWEGDWHLHVDQSDWVSIKPTLPTECLTWY